MSNPYIRTSTPAINYEGTLGDYDCFRVRLRGEDGMNALLFRGEITEYLLKEGIEHRFGNTLPGLQTPENKDRKDFFLVLRRPDIPAFTAAFEVLGYSPDLVG
jgi:hypothetical protein